MLGYQAVGAVKETVGAAGDAIGAAFQPANSDLLAGMGGVGASSAGVLDSVYELLFADEAEAEDEALGIEAEEGRARRVCCTRAGSGSSSRS